MVIAPSRFILDCRSTLLDCRPGHSQVMGILNVTPDSFSDGGQFNSTDQAVRQALRMLDEGASIIDVGGASSRPAGKAYGKGAGRVPPDEECARVVPVIERLLAERPDALVSIDTFEPQVATAALAAGAHIVNDITGLRHAPEIANIAARFGAPLILMHSVGGVGDMPHTVEYETDALTEVVSSLRESLEEAERRGVIDVAVDPGFGFGKTMWDNLRLIARSDALLDLGRPVLIGVSRKSSIGMALGSIDAPTPIDQRLFGSLGATAVAVIRGASIVRTHDVAPTIEMLRVLHATLAAGGDPSGAISYHATPPEDSC